MAKGLSLADFKKSNLLVTLVVLGIVLFLLFMPDFFGLHSNFNPRDATFSLKVPKPGETKVEIEDIRGEESESTETSSDIQVEEVLKREEPASLDTVSQLIDNGYIDRLADNKEKIADAESARMRANIEMPQGDSDTNRDLSEILKGDRITWEQLKGKPSQRVLRKVQSQTSELMTRIPADKVESRYALLNFMAGIDRILEGSERSLTPRQAVTYLERLDLEVSRAFLKEGVPRAEYIEWSKISLAAVLGSKRSERFKVRSQPTFDPKLRLQEVLFFRRADHHGRVSPRDPAYLNFETTLEGKEVKKAMLLKNGKYMRDLRLEPTTPEADKFKIVHRQLEADAVYTIAIVDKSGERYQKIYDFNAAKKPLQWNYDRIRNIFQADAPLKGGSENPWLDTYFNARRGKDGRSLRDGLFTSFIDRGNQIAVF